MLLALGAASSAIDALKALTSTKPTTGVKQDAPNLFAFSADAAASTGASSGSGGGKSPPISPETMSALLAAQSQSGTDASASMRSGSLKEWFAKVDSDADGKISKSEFEALGADNSASGDDIFSKLDKDGDGSISAAELLAALKGKPKHRDQQSDPLLQALQGMSSTSATNSDGSVTASASSAATSSYTFIDQLVQRQSSMISAQASSSLSVSV
jgi:Ca2+-binding EF-hand superfamily protein